MQRTGAERRRRGLHGPPETPRGQVQSGAGAACTAPSRRRAATGTPRPPLPQAALSVLSFLKPRLEGPRLVTLCKRGRPVLRRRADPASSARQRSRVGPAFPSPRRFSRACLCCPLTRSYKQAKKIPSHFARLRIYETCSPDKYFLLKKKIRQLINGHYNALRRFNSIEQLSQCLAKPRGQPLINIPGLGSV